MTSSTRHNRRSLMFLALPLVLLAALGCEGRIQLLDPSSPTPHHKGAAHELKGRLTMPLRSEAGSAGDSNTYFVKLPPSQHYYSALTSHVPFEKGQTHLRRLLPVNFASNGRPARVYHWNMPLLRRMSEQQQAQARRHSPGRHAPISAVTPKPRRAYKKANAKKADSQIFHIVRLEKNEHQPSGKHNNFKARAHQPSSH